MYYCMSRAGGTAVSTSAEYAWLKGVPFESSSEYRCSHFDYEALAGLGACGIGAIGPGMGGTRAMTPGDVAPIASR